MEARAILSPASGELPIVSQKRACTVRRIGQIPYREAWRLQQALVAKRKAREIPDMLLLLEHAPVITMGRNGKPEHLLTPAETLAKEGVEVVETDRGGETTYHGPGQLIGYPILDLGAIRKDVVWYVRTLEEVLIRTASDFGIGAGRVAGCTGVWVNGAKVASIGIHISRWVTSHGFALNLETDLSYFRHIVPCGIASCPVTSFRELLRAPVDRVRVEERLTEHMGDLFGLAMVLGQPEAWKGESLAS
jgi:lipoyl(octanoyl) transferase